MKIYLSITSIQRSGCCQIVSVYARATGWNLIKVLLTAHLTARQHNLQHYEAVKILRARGAYVDRSAG